LVSVTMKELLEAGVHFGHQTKRWNPKMKEYIFGLKNNIHIIDLEKTLVALNEATNFLTEVAAKGPILFVGTKRQARDIVQSYAIESGSYFITYRWLGGLLSNFKMIKKSITKFIELCNLKPSSLLALSLKFHRIVLVEVLAGVPIDDIDRL
jgi:small subunit ribosomal protein S2